jgi:hypothetical protein
MASNIKIDATLRNTIADAITTRVGASGVLKIYSGTQPTNPATALVAQVLLATLPCSATFAPAASGGVLTASAITTANAAATGTAAWYSLQTSGGTRVIEGSVGTATSDLILNTVSIVSGGPVAVTSFTYTAPGG